MPTISIGKDSAGRSRDRIVRSEGVEPRNGLRLSGNESGRRCRGGGRSWLCQLSGNSRSRCSRDRRHSRQRRDGWRRNSNNRDRSRNRNRSRSGIGSRSMGNCGGDRSEIDGSRGDRNSDGNRTSLSICTGDRGIGRSRGDTRVDSAVSDHCIGRRICGHLRGVLVPIRDSNERLDRNKYETSTSTSGTGIWLCEQC